MFELQAGNPIRPNEALIVATRVLRTSVSVIGEEKNSGGLAGPHARFLLIAINMTVQRTKMMTKKAIVNHRERVIYCIVRLWR